MDVRFSRFSEWCHFPFLYLGHNSHETRHNLKKTFSCFCKLQRKCKILNVVKIFTFKQLCKNNVKLQLNFSFFRKLLSFFGRVPNKRPNYSIRLTCYYLCNTNNPQHHSPSYFVPWNLWIFPTWLLCGELWANRPVHCKISIFSLCEISSGYS